MDSCEERTYSCRSGYSHTNEILYHASLQVQLAPSCPKDVGFLCQFTFDSLPEGRTPRLLAFDVLAPLPQGPVQRGEALRALAPR